MLVPNGFRPIAVMDDNASCCVISYNLETKTFFVVVDGVPFGPITLRNMDLATANMRDVIEQRGQYNFIDSYNSDGSRSEF